MPIPRDEAPLLVTAHLDAASFAVLDGLRRRHFPAELNIVPAHVSLVHHLPEHAAQTIIADVAAACRGWAAFELWPSDIRSLGRGVAVRYDSHGLQELRASLVRSWSAWLTPQDRQPFKPHVTIQNKVTADRARSLLAALTLDDVPVCRVEGVSVWRYLGGPWEAVTTCLFADQNGVTTS